MTVLQTGGGPGIPHPPHPAPTQTPLSWVTAPMSTASPHPHSLARREDLSCCPLVTNGETEAREERSLMENDLRPLPRG